MGEFSVWHWIVVGLFLWLIFAAFRKASRTEGQLLCTSCGSIGDGKTKTGGSLLIEIVLWICFIVPGLIYSLWRLTTRKKGCSVCGATTLVPKDSPIAQKLLRDLKVP